MEKITYEEYKKALDIVLKYREHCASVIKEVESATGNNESILDYRIIDCDLTVRALNGLFGAYGLDRNTTVKELSTISRSALLMCRGFGRKSIIEIDDLCYKAGIVMLP